MGFRQTIPALWSFSPSYAVLGFQNVFLFTHPPPLRRRVLPFLSLSYDLLSLQNLASHDCGKIEILPIIISFLQTKRRATDKQLGQHFLKELNAASKNSNQSGKQQKAIQNVLLVGYKLLYTDPFNYHHILRNSYFIHLFWEHP